MSKNLYVVVIVAGDKIEPVYKDPFSGNMVLDSLKDAMALQAEMKVMFPNPQYEIFKLIPRISRQSKVEAKS
jgi:hypothetical protein